MRHIGLLSFFTFACSMFLSAQSQVQYIANQPTGDFGSMLQSCITNAGLAGGVCDARTMGGTQFINKPVVITTAMHVYMPVGNITCQTGTGTDCIDIKAPVDFEMQTSTRTTGVGGTILMAGSTFTGPLIRVFGSADNKAEGTVIHGGLLQGYSTRANDGIDVNCTYHVTIRDVNFDSNGIGIAFQNTGRPTGFSEGSVLDNLEFLLNGTAIYTLADQGYDSSVANNSWKNIRINLNNAGDQGIYEASSSVVAWGGLHDVKIWINANNQTGYYSANSSSGNGRLIDTFTCEAINTSLTGISCMKFAPGVAMPTLINVSTLGFGSGNTPFTFGTSNMWPDTSGADNSPAFSAIMNRPFVPATFNFVNLPPVSINPPISHVLPGSIVYCSDCRITSPCAGGGTGAIAKALNGAWVCN